MQLPHRRRYLYLALGTGGALGLGMTGFLRRDNTDLEPAGGLPSVTRTSRAFGTQASITVLHPDRELADRAINAALAELKLVEQLMSLYRSDSQLCRLNRRRVLEKPHPYLVGALRKASETSQRSGGAFDVTVQPLWTLYAEAKRRGTLPEPPAVERARKSVDWRRVEVTRRRVRLHGDGAAVTLNGIAQGLAADRAAAVMRKHGIRHALVDTGEIGALGGKADQEAWTVGIRHPRRPDAHLGLARLQGRCLATSGDYATHFSPDYRNHHLFDPRTGRSPEKLASVTVAAATAMEADALSTAVLVLGPEKGLQLVRSTPAADALFVLKGGATLATEGFPLES